MNDSPHLSEDSIKLLVHGALSTADAASASTHLESCADCRNVLARLQSRDTREGQSDDDMATLDTDPHATRFVVQSRAAHVRQLRPEGAGQDGTANAGPVSLHAGDQLGRYRVIRQLGAGGFGTVYLADDEQLQRRVAIKIPNLQFTTSTTLPTSYLEEARTVAALDHPHIATVFDVGSSDQIPVYVVSKFIDGCDLATKVRTDPPSLLQAIRWTATIAEALHYAHKQGVVHRDVKPQNILSDSHGKIYLVDFGLALREVDSGRGTKSAGTPAYMSPEQVRGEGHRVDGRSDVFSLGIVLYELLSGRRPFNSKSTHELFQQIALYDPKPLRQINESIPVEVERICFRALAKRVSDRYSSAQDFAQELLDYAEDIESRPLSVRRQSSGPAHGTALRSDVVPLQAVPLSPIVPKGLRAFDGDDADFFIRLLPGPYDRNGLSQNLRFWKNRLDSANADPLLRAGLIYGPSGCGKSSFIRAGLIPRLNSNIVAVYVEASSQQTELRLRTSIQRTLPQFSTERTLKSLLTSVRRQGIYGGERKLLIVIDQFEQWLQGRVEYRCEELTDALRQADGINLQVMLLVRDEFWLAVSRFLRELEVPVIEGENCTLQDLFDVEHSRYVLAQFGRAYGKLPPENSPLTKDQTAFLERAVQDLAAEERVSPIQLAIFSEMLKSRNWTLASLRTAGGAMGLGEAFLETSFSSSHAPAQNRNLQHAARDVLRVLLPTRGTQLKGQSHSQDELWKASGLENAGDFELLLDILENRMRLISRVHRLPNEQGDACLPVLPQFQLTHDFLVPSITNWLHRKRSETYKGRIAISFEQHADLWQSNPRKGNLPGPFDSLKFISLISPRVWTSTQRRMMSSAARLHAKRIGVVIALFAIFGLIFEDYRARVAESHSQEIAAAKLSELLGAETKRVPQLLTSLVPYRRWIEQDLKQLATDEPPGSQSRLHAQMALASGEPALSREIAARLPDAAPGDLQAFFTVLRPYRDELVESFWAALESDRSLTANGQLCLAAALAQFDSHDERWAGHAGKIARLLVDESPASINFWGDNLSGIKAVLTAELKEVFFNNSGEFNSFQREMCLNYLLDFAADDPNVLAEIFFAAPPKYVSKVIDRLSQHRETAVAWMTDETREHLPPAQPLPALSKRTIEVVKDSVGTIAATYAFCQRMPLEMFEQVNDDLANASFRLGRLRPYAMKANDDQANAHSTAIETYVAAIWVRTERPTSRYRMGLSKEMVHQIDAEAAAAGLVMIDAAGYLQETGGRIEDKYAAAWCLPDSPFPENQVSKFYVGVTYDEISETEETFVKEDYQNTQSLQTFVGSDGKMRFTAVMNRFDFPNERCLDEPLAASRLDLEIDKSLWDLSLSAAATVSDQPETAGIGAAARPVSPISADENGRIRMAATWTALPGAESRYVMADDQAIYMTKCAALQQDGFHPVAVATLAIKADQPLRYASVWRRYGKREKAPALADRRAKACLALLMMNEPAPVWAWLDSPSDPSLPSLILHYAVQHPLAAKLLADRLKTEERPGAAAMIILASGKHSHMTFAGAMQTRGSDRGSLAPHVLQSEVLLEEFENSVDPGVHSAAEWTLRRWGHGTEVNEICNRLATGRVIGNRRWYYSKQQHAMMIHEVAELVPIGSPRDEPSRDQTNEQRHFAPVGRSIAISSKEVTVEQFTRFKMESGIPHFYEQIYSPEPTCPQTGVTWYEAAQYCRWLSEKEGVPETEMCYPPIAEIKPGMAEIPDFADRQGYRLPTEAEWEWGCRAGTNTDWHWGVNEGLAADYAWFLSNATNRTHPVGSLMPNQFGLFDAAGNAWEQIHGRDMGYETDSVGLTLDDNMMRGGGFFSPAAQLRSAFRFKLPKQERHHAVGMRIVRTIKKIQSQ